MSKIPLKKRIDNVSELASIPLSPDFPENEDLRELVTACSQYIRDEYQTLEQQDSKFLGFIKPIFLAVDFLFKASAGQDRIGLSPESIAEKWLKIFIQHAPSCVALFDEEFRYVTVSKAWKKTFFYPDGGAAADKDVFLLENFSLSKEFREKLQ